MKNPLIKYLEVGDEYIPFDSIQPQHFEDAFAEAFNSSRNNLTALLANSESPTFENTIEAIEYLDEDLTKVLSIFNNLKEAHTNEKINALAEIILPQVAQWSNDILLNEMLFERVRTVYENKPPLTTEQERLLLVTYRSFTRNGAALTVEQKKQLREYDEQLSLLSQKFSKQLLDATNEYTLTINNETDLSGLPDRVVLAAKDEAIKRGVPAAWVFTLKGPSVGPFLQYADNAALRKEIATAQAARGMNAPYDNTSVVLDMVSLRAKRAKLLGYDSHASYVLEERMAKKAQTVHLFLGELASASRPRAREEFDALAAYKEKTTGEKTLHPWDIAYFTEKLRKEKYDFDEEEVRKYFSVENVLRGVFDHVERLYGATAHPRHDIPVYHEDVVVYEMRDGDGRHLGIVYFDLYPRESKRGGGWIDALRGQHMKNGNDIRPQLLIVCNLTKSTTQTPSLLSFFEAETIFHEFGHALHNLFSTCTYRSLGGFNTLWDFVELPSQFMDAFLEDARSVKIMAKHYETNEVIPSDLLAKMTAAKNFMIGWSTLSQVGVAVLDMKWHDGSADTATDVQTFEHAVREPYRFVSPIPGTSSTASFSHIFSGGYSAGYYSYHWAEVLAADAFEYFQENGLFSREIADSFREHILSKGNTVEPAELYRRFRGRDATPAALLRSTGLL